MIPPKSNDRPGNDLAELRPAAPTRRRPRTDGLKPPKVYGAITAVSAELARKGIAKNQINTHDQYQYRGIDDVYNRLSPALAAHKLCILPRVLERTSVERSGANGTLLMSVSLKMAFDIVCAKDGSRHTIKTYGEALDAGDKATSKAMTSAYKYAMLQAFCIPLSGIEDADATSHQLSRSAHVPEPVQGWEQWAKDISDVVRGCESSEALDRLQDMNRQLLKGISRERPDLYTHVGETIRERRLAFASSAPAQTEAKGPPLNGRPPPKAKPITARARQPKSSDGGAHA